MASRKEYDLIFKIAAETAGSFNKSFSAAGQAVSSLRATTQNVNSALKNIDGYNKTQSALEANRAKMAELTAEHTRLQNEINNTENPSAKLNKQLAKNEEQMAKTAAKIEQEETKLSSLNAELRNAGVNTDNLSSETERLSQEYDNLKNAQDRINGINVALSKNASAIQSTKAEFGKTAMAAGLFGAAMYKGAIKPAIDFEAQMSTVKAISNASDADMAKLTDTASELGRTTKFSAVEAGKGMEYAAMAGWKTNQIIAGMPGIMSLAAASGEDLATVSDIVTDALSAMKMKAEDAGHFSDVLAAASSNANTNVGMLGESFKYCAPLAGAYGFNIEDTALMLSLMANNGIKASNSGTAFRKILAAMSSDFAVAQKDGSDFVVTTANADGSMRSLGDIINDTRKAFNGMSDAEKKAAQNNLKEAADDLAISLTDENGKLKSQAELYEEVAAAAEGLTAAGKVQEAEAIAGKTAMAGLLAIINTSDEDYNKLAEAIYNCDGAAKRMEQTRLDNLQGDLILAESAAKGLQIALGNALTPALRETVQGIIPVISNMAAWAEKNPETVAGVTKLIAKLLALKLGLLAGKLGFLEIQKGVLLGQKAFATYKGALAAVSVATGETVTTTSLLTSAVGLLTNPVGLAVAGIGVLGGAIYLFKKHQEAARQETLNFADDLKNAADNFEKVSKKADDTQSLIDEYRTLQEVIKNTADGTQENADAKSRLKEVEDALIENSDGLITKYDKENGAIDENLSYLERKLSKEKEIARIQLQQEGYETKRKLPNTLKEIKNLKQQSVDLNQDYNNTVKVRNELGSLIDDFEVGGYDQKYTKGQISPETYYSTLNNYLDKANAVSDRYGLDTNFTDISSVMSTFGEYEDKASELVKNIETTEQELNTATTSVQTYYDTQKQLIELDLGMTFESAVKSYKDMNTELEKLTENGQGSSQRAQELKNKIAELEPKLATATQGMQNLGQSVKDVPEVITVDTSQAIANCGNLSSKVSGLDSQLRSLPKNHNVVFGATVSASFARAVAIVQEGLRMGAQVTANASNSVFAATVGKKAIGGIVNRPILTTFAERSPEAAIPIDNSTRSKQLWKTTGRLLGMNEEPVYSALPKLSTTTINNSNSSVTINPVYHIYGNQDLSDQLAEHDKALVNTVLNAISEQEERRRRLSYA